MSLARMAGVNDITSLRTRSETRWRWRNSVTCGASPEFEDSTNNALSSTTSKYILPQTNARKKNGIGHVGGCKSISSQSNNPKTHSSPVILTDLDPTLLYHRRKLLVDSDFQSEISPIINRDDMIKSSNRLIPEYKS
jgi:hypothetical protein